MKTENNWIEEEKTLCGMCVDINVEVEKCEQIHETNPEKITRMMKNIEL